MGNISVEASCELHIYEESWKNVYLHKLIFKANIIQFTSFFDTTLME